MTEEERKIFWKLDDKLYLVDKNKTYKKLFSSIHICDIDNISQNFINKLIAWYILKYDVKYIDSIINNKFIVFNHTDLKNDLIGKRVLIRDTDFNFLYYIEFINYDVKNYSEVKNTYLSNKFKDDDLVDVVYFEILEKY